MQDENADGISYHKNIAALLSRLVNITVIKVGLNVVMMTSCQMVSPLSFNNTMFRALNLLLSSEKIQT